jgi:hypothetical protein
LDTHATKGSDHTMKQYFAPIFKEMLFVRPQHDDDLVSVELIGYEEPGSVLTLNCCEHVLCLKMPGIRAESYHNSDLKENDH